MPSDTAAAARPCVARRSKTPRDDIGGAPRARPRGRRPTTCGKDPHDLSVSVRLTTAARAKSDGGLGGVAASPAPIPARRGRGPWTIPRPDTARAGCARGYTPNHPLFGSRSDGRLAGGRSPSGSPHLTKGGPVVESDGSAGMLRRRSRWTSTIVGRHLSPIGEPSCRPRASRAPRRTIPSQPTPRERPITAPGSRRAGPTTMASARAIQP